MHPPYTDTQARWCVVWCVIFLRRGGGVGLRTECGTRLSGTGARRLVNNFSRPPRPPGPARSAARRRAPRTHAPARRARRRWRRARAAESTFWQATGPVARPVPVARCAASSCAARRARRAQRPRPPQASCLPSRSRAGRSRGPYHRPTLASAPRAPATGRWPRHWRQSAPQPPAAASTGACAGRGRWQSARCPAAVRRSHC
mmetsp:Transcript_29324/g.94545  ORF Transcript_29324/g.94545 Transcript_29324/m.94545 type:complete len:202 (+) Transcript_29324:215-820(+)|eukprot:scaffold15213_cov101-Isochrysis_galbana.AAC.1